MYNFFRPDLALINTSATGPSARRNTPRDSLGNFLQEEHGLLTERTKRKLPELIGEDGFPGQPLVAPDLRPWGRYLPG